jgi:hypothetical protein
LFSLVGIGYSTILHMGYAELYKLFEADEHCIGLFVGPWFDPYIPPVDILQLCVYISQQRLCWQLLTVYLSTSHIDELS